MVLLNSGLTHTVRIHGCGAGLSSSTEAWTDHMIIFIDNSNGGRRRPRPFQTSLSPHSPTSYLSVSRGFDVRVAVLTDDVVDVVQAVGGDAGKGLGTV